MLQTRSAHPSARARLRSEPLLSSPLFLNLQVPPLPAAALPKPFAKVLSIRRRLPTGPNYWCSACWPPCSRRAAGLRWTFRGWPVSTTHSIVGAIVGFAVAGIGIDAVAWGKIGQIVASWVVSPVLGGLVAFGLMMSIRKLILQADKPFESAVRWAPIYLFLVGFVISLVTIFKGLKHLNIDLNGYESAAVAALIGIITALIGQRAIRRVSVNETMDQTAHLASVERVFAPMIVFTACAMAFAHGSNDVANGVGPLAAVYGLIHSGGEVTQKLAMPVWILALGGGGIVLGLVTYGYRVMRTIGTKITALTPTSGFCATVAAALTVVIASRTAMPVSTTHIAVGAVMGVGMARGIAAIDLRVIGSIFASWVVTLPAGGILAALFFFMLKGMFT